MREFAEFDRSPQSTFAGRFQDSANALAAHAEALNAANKTMTEFMKNSAARNSVPEGIRRMVTKEYNITVSGIGPEDSNGIIPVSTPSDDMVFKSRINAARSNVLVALTGDGGDNKGLGFKSPQDATVIEFVNTAFDKALTAYQSKLGKSAPPLP